MISGHFQTVCSFSTSFLFILVPSKSSYGGFGFTFTISPTTNFEFDTVQGFRDGADARGNHIGLNFNSVTSDVQEPVVYTSDEGRKEDFQHETEPIRVRLDYNGSTQMLNLIVSPAKFPIAPSIPLISQRVPKLLDIVQEEMYVGFTAGDMSRVLTI
ncbi:BnaC02g16850D [Brassica napus]|uniref:BnaC02g16850D protein n=1 Tax=Brassica napus TaxID=3708 RepID=A0A078ING6_BRANA|nr:BnaC02g16850D [Brassica napus]